MNTKDIFYLKHEKPPSYCYAFDLSRSKPSDISLEDTFAAIEALKNGYCISTKYVPKKRLQWPAMILVFMNFHPSKKNLSLLSLDRWRINVMIEEMIPYHIRQQRKANMERIKKDDEEFVRKSICPQPALLDDVKDDMMIMIMIMMMTSSSYQSY